jgi:hypothetical protein
VGHDRGDSYGATWPIEHGIVQCLKARPPCAVASDLRPPRRSYGLDWQTAEASTIKQSGIKKMPDGPKSQEVFFSAFTTMALTIATKRPVCAS